MLKDTIVDTWPGKTGILLTVCATAVFVYARFVVNPIEGDQFWLDMKLYSFWAANVGLALTFWSSCYVLGLRMLEGLERQQKRVQEKRDHDGSEKSAPPRVVKTDNKE